MVIRSTTFPLVLCILLLTILVGCGDSKPLLIEDVKAERLTLQALYLTVDGEEALAARSKGDSIVAPDGKNIAFRAYLCKNPDCPGKDKGKNGRPFLYIWRDPMWRVNDAGLIEYDVVPDRAEQFVLRGSTIEPTCPECAKLRDQENEDPETSQKYRDWTAYYVLPATAKRDQELNEAHQARLKYIKEHQN
jgi:hypothetical protein